MFLGVTPTILRPSVLLAVPGVMWSATDKNAGISLSNNNRTATSSGSGQGVRAEVYKSSGAFAAEFVPVSISGNPYAGLSTSAATRDAAGSGNYGWRPNGVVVKDGSVQSSLDTFGVGDKIVVAYVNGAVRFYKNGALLREDAWTPGAVTPWFAAFASDGATTLSDVFTPPSGLTPWPAV